MPTILNEDGLRVVIWTNEGNHDLPHVHVFCGDGWVSVSVGDATTVPTILGFARGMKRSEVRRALNIVANHQDECLAGWRRYHG